MKRAVVVATVLLISATLGGCDFHGDRAVTVHFWNGFTGPDGRTMLALVKRFNAENPDVHVLMQRMDWSTYYSKLFVAGLGGRAPEVFVSHVINLERFLQADFVRPVDDLLAGPNGLDTTDLLPSVWDAVEKDGRHYAVPLDVHAIGLYYNRDLFAQAGLPGPPRDRAEFMHALERLTRDVDGDGNPDQWGYVFTWFRTNVVSIMRQFGGRFFTEDCSRCTLDEPENVEALQFCVDLIRKYRFVPPPENFDAWIGFRQGKVGMAFEGTYMLPDLLKQEDLDYGAAPLPLLGSTPAAWAGAHTLCLRNGMDEQKTEAAWRFVRFLSDHSLDWAEGGQIPARNSLRATERFAGMKAQAAFAEQLPYICFGPLVPFIFEFYTEFDAAVEKTLRGSATPQDALATATENVNGIIARHHALLEEAAR